MVDFLTFKHSFNSGDLLSVLPGIKRICAIEGKKAVIYQRLNLPADYSSNDHHPIKNDEGIQVCMNQYMFDMLKPLIEYQDYVEEFKVWKGEEVIFDYDLTRMNSQMPLPGGNIYYWPTLIFPQLMPDLKGSWLKSEHTHENRYDFKDCILINRTERYRNPYIHFYFLKEHQDKIMFVGTKREWELFNKDFDLSVKRLDVENFYFLAMFIANCRFFIGNQSMCAHIADGVFAPRILEICTQFPNTFPSNENGRPFINQGSLEYHFNRLLKETE